MNIMRLRQLRYMIHTAVNHSRWLPEEGTMDDSNENAPRRFAVKQHLLDTLTEIDDIIGDNDEDF
jgi:hypothetical protein